MEPHVDGISTKEEDEVSVAGTTSAPWNAQAAETVLTLEKRLKKLKDLETMNESVQSLSPKDFSGFEKNIVRTIRQISGVEEDSVKTKSNAIVNIFRDPGCILCISLATFAKTMVSSRGNPFACSLVIVNVASQFPQVMEILLAEFHKACIYTVPMHTVNSQTVWDSDAYEHLDCIMRLYGALVQTDIRGGEVTNSHGIEHGWAWLERFVDNNISDNSIASAIALNAFLQTAGFGLHQRYTSQFVKVMDVLREHFLTKLSAREDLQMTIANITAYLDEQKYLKEPRMNYEDESLVDGV